MKRSFGYGLAVPSSAEIQLKKLYSECKWTGGCAGDRCAYKPLPLDRSLSDSCRLKDFELLGGDVVTHVDIFCKVCDEDVTRYVAHCTKNATLPPTAPELCMRWSMQMAQAAKWLMKATGNSSISQGFAFDAAQQTMLNKSLASLSLAFGDDGPLILELAKKVWGNGAAVVEDIEGQVALYTLIVRALLKGTSAEKVKARQHIRDIGWNGTKTAVAPTVLQEKYTKQVATNISNAINTVTSFAHGLAKQRTEKASSVEVSRDNQAVMESLSAMGLEIVTMFLLLMPVVASVPALQALPVAAGAMHLVFLVAVATVLDAEAAVEEGAEFLEEMFNGSSPVPAAASLMAFPAVLEGLFDGLAVVNKGILGAHDTIAGEFKHQIETHGPGIVDVVQREVRSHIDRNSNAIDHSLLPSIRAEGNGILYMPRRPFPLEPPPVQSGLLSSPTGEIKVLSYNLCYGCITPTLADLTAMRDDLAAQCMRTDAEGISVCATNIGRGIERYANAIGGYDFMGFQEVSPEILTNLGLADRTVGGRLMGDIYATASIHQFVMTMYDKEKFGMPDMTLIGPTRERPHFVALVFDAHELIFINLHNGHTGAHFRSFPQVLDQALQMSHPNMERRRRYRVILVGDFNDAGEELVRRGVKLPWLTKRLRAAVTPKTCCSANLTYNPTRPGDYILDSDCMASMQVPPSYDATLPQSDHRPVEAVLRFLG